MGCGCGKTLTPVKFEAIHQKKNAQDTLQLFFLSNAGTLQPFYQSLRQEEAKAVSYLPVTRGNPADMMLTVSDWTLRSHIPEVLEQLTHHICDYHMSCEVFKELNSLFELVGYDMSTTFHLLRILFYLYKQQIAQRKAGDSSLWTLEASQQVYIQKIFRRGQKLLSELSIPRAINAKEQLHLGCYFSALILFPEQTMPETRTEDVYNAVLRYCLSPYPPVQLVTAGLYFCLSCIHSKQISTQILKKFPADSFTVHNQETFNQLTEVLNCYQTSSDEVWNQVFRELETWPLVAKFDALTRYLEQPDEIEKFIAYFQRPSGHAVSQLLSLCPILVQSSAAAGFETCHRLMNRMLPLINLATLSQETFSVCESEISQLYQYQFPYDALSRDFSEKYFNQLISSKVFTDGELRDQLAMMLLYTMTQHSGVDLLSRRINTIFENCLTQQTAYLDIISNSIRNCLRLVPELREDVTEAAERVLSTLKERRDGLLPIVTTPWESTKIYHFVDDLTSMFRCDSGQVIRQIPPTMLETIMAYLQYGDMHFDEVNSGEFLEKRQTVLSEAMEKSKKALGGIDDSKVNLSLYSTPEHFPSFVCCAILRNIEKLREITNPSEEIKSKWKGHFRILRFASKSTIMALAFDQSQALELQVFALTLFLSTFEKKRKFSKPEKVFKKSMKLEKEVIGVYLSGFERLTGSYLTMMNTVAQSVCLREAFTNLKFKPDCLSICPRMTYFADLEQNTFGISILGGYIILSNRLREYTDRSKCGLMVTMAHELGHMGIRIEGNSITRARSVKCQYQYGRPGDTKNTTVTAKEGGFRLETELFGARVVQLSNSQMEFLMNKKNWERSLVAFRTELCERGFAARESEVHNIPRTEFGLHYLERGKACRFKGS